MSFSWEVKKLIADLRGVPYGPNLSGSRKPILLDNLIEAALKRHRIGQASLEDTIMAQWRMIVGEQAAHRCRPRNLVDGKKLIIIATNHTLKSELLFRKTHILQKLQSLPGCETINEVEIKTG